MQSLGNPRGGDGATSLPSGFKYFVGAAALFIAGCSAYFSVLGLGLLFIGASTAVMIMASSLEVGKLVAASFLYRYWNDISRSLRAYLFAAVVILIAITSLGNYGYLARAYERTHTKIVTLEDQIAMLEKENADTQRQIDAARSQLHKTSDAGQVNLASLQGRIQTADASLDAALARLQEKRHTAQARRDRDLALLQQNAASRSDALIKAIATEDALLAGLNDQLAVLDRAVDAYTKQGGPGFFKADNIKKGEELRARQASQRAALEARIAEHRARQEQLTAELAQHTRSLETEIATLRQHFDTEWAALDDEEKQLRQTHRETITQVEQQIAGLQNLSQTTTATGTAQIDALYQRIRARNDDIRHLREQIAATDIGSYRFVARAFDASADSVVKWLILALVIVFDPLAVCLAVGFNVALLRDLNTRRYRQADPRRQAIDTAAAPAPTGNGRARWATLGLSVVLLAAATGGIAVAAHYGFANFRQAAQSKHGHLVPADSFAVAALRPETAPQTLAPWTGELPARLFTDLLQNGFDRQADVYLFAKFPAQPSATDDRPVLVAGLVARVTDPVAAEAALGRVADQISAALRPRDMATPARGRAMIHYGRGRYLDPEGGFFTFGLGQQSAILLVELEGNPDAPIIEREIQACLRDTDNRDSLPARALVRDGVAGVWFDAARFFTALPKNSAAQARYQQLQRFLDFELILKFQPAAILAEYTYRNDRFKDRRQPTALQTLAALGDNPDAGIVGQLMDRCADTLDFDSLIERLRTTWGSLAATAQPDVLVEKTYSSDRHAQFIVSARATAPVAAAPVASAR